METEKWFTLVHLSSLRVPSNARRIKSKNGTTESIPCDEEGIVSQRGAGHTRKLLHALFSDGFPLGAH